VVGLGRPLGFVNQHGTDACRTEIDQEIESDAVIGHIKTAVVALETFDAGDAASSIKVAMRAIKAIVDKLPD
jgi:hypothetical protein